jgi:hypothetical protein
MPALLETDPAVRPRLRNRELGFLPTTELVAYLNICFIHARIEAGTAYVKAAIYLRLYLLL